MLNIFIDGQAGTTGLKLEERLKTRNDINLLIIDPSRRKDPATRQNLMAKADVVFLCLPEDEAIKAASMAPPDTIVIDASTAHRVAPGWVYGLPELSVAHRTAISTAKRIAVPGCHAAGFIAMVYPLLESGIISRDAKLNCNSLTGYSGGGRTMIEEYENNRTPGDYLQAPRPYALGLKHKHLPEMKGICGLEHAPHFVPTVCDIAQGMFVTVPLWGCNVEDVWQAWSQHYRYSKFIQVKEIDNNGIMNMTECNNTNRMDLFVYGHETQLLLGARLDNLGKGASGAALQCMNIACGLDEGLGLED
ncbi:MAG: N-acetyl-gamma-glutamyl-phosphate reductase [Defluviitaleaceae bacterium]|nr:N-acetyl-gamma-glutamyl-phosphate reductase [Defluviitaleaceae bacterium]